MTTSAVNTKKLQLRGIRLEQFTITYNVIEGFIAISAGLIASFVSLVGFGFDSGIEVFAAILVLTKLRAQFYSSNFDEEKERKALKLIGVTFFLLATYVAITSFRNLLIDGSSEVSPVGIALTSLSVLIMPILAHQKMSTGRKLGSRLLMADAKETQLCAWLSVSTLTGLLTFYFFSWNWVDSVASLVIAVFAINEGREAWAGELACDDCNCIGKCTC